MFQAFAAGLISLPTRKHRDVLHLLRFLRFSCDSPLRYLVENALADILEIGTEVERHNAHLDLHRVMQRRNQIAEAADQRILFRWRQ